MQIGSAPEQFGFLSSHGVQTLVLRSHVHLPGTLNIHDGCILWPASNRTLMAACIGSACKAARPRACVNTNPHVSLPQVQDFCGALGGAKAAEEAAAAGIQEARSITEKPLCARPDQGHTWQCKRPLLGCQ